MNPPDTAARISALLRERLSPQQLEILDDSAAHAGHGAVGGHFRVRVVSTDFRNLSPLARHRLVNALLAPLYASEVHALTLETLTPEEITSTKLSN